VRCLFLSYAHQNAAFAQRLASDLRSDEVTVWIDDQGIKVGDSLPRELELALEQHDYFVPILSPEYFESAWCKQELRSALVRNIEKGIALLPVLYRECRIPALLCDKVYADFRDDYRLGLAALIAALRASRQAASTEIPTADVIVGGFRAESLTYVSFGGDNYHPWMTTRPVASNDGPSSSDLSIEFDLTSYASSALRITSVNIEVQKWQPITQAVQGINGILGLGTTRWFFGRFGKRLGTYPCRFAVPNDPTNEHGYYLKLTEREMEVFRLKLTTQEEGIYDLGITVVYSIGGKAKAILAGTIRDCVFHNCKTYMELLQMYRRANHAGATVAR
jgi:hypothetical protein